MIYVIETAERFDDDDPSQASRHAVLRDGVREGQAVPGWEHAGGEAS